jgi:hypothetical protein
MAHLQQQVLDSIKATLEAAGLRVFVDREDPLQSHELPAVLVDESPEGETISGTDLGPILQRTLAVRLRCVVAGGVAMAQARALGLQTEQAMVAPSTPLALLAKGGVALQGSRPSLGGDGDRLAALREQDWAITYFSTAEAPDVAV